MQQKGVDHLSYMEQICRQSLEVEYETLDREVFCVLHFATTVKDEKIRNKMISLGTPNKGECNEISKFMSTQVSSDSVGKKETIESFDAFQEDHREPRQRVDGSFRWKTIGKKMNHKSRQYFERQQGIKQWKPCLRCGNHSDDCSVLARGLSCDACGKKGHIAIVCNSRAIWSFTTDRVDDDDDKSNKEDLHPDVTPHMKAQISHENWSFIFSTFPDTGGCLTLISSDIANEMKIPVDINHATPRLVAVNGKKIRVDGVASIRVENLCNGVVTRILAVVSPDLKRDIIIGFRQLKKLKVISKSFPILRFSINKVRAHVGFNKKEKEKKSD